MWIHPLGQEDPLEEGMPTHFRILAWRIDGQRSLAGYSPWGHNKSDTTEALLLVSVAGIHLDGWGSKCVPTWGTCFMIGWCPSEDERSPTEKFPPTRPGAGEGLGEASPSLGAHLGLTMAK